MLSSLVVITSIHISILTLTLSLTLYLTLSIPDPIPVPIPDPDGEIKADLGQGFDHLTLILTAEADGGAAGSS